MLLPDPRSHTRKTGDFISEEKKEKNFGIAKDSNLTEEQWEKVKEEEAAENE